MILNLESKFIMPKNKRKKRRTKSEAWKQLVQGHKRGPKRIRMKKEVTIEDIEHDETRRVQLVIDDMWERDYVYVIMSDVAFLKSRMKKKRTIYRTRVKGHFLWKTFYALDHNAIVMKERRTISLNIDTPEGIYACEVIVVGGQVRRPSATLYISNTIEDTKHMDETHEYVKALFNKKFIPCIVPTERM